MIEEIKKHKFMAILRRVPEEKIEKTVQALFLGGVRIMEVTFDPLDCRTVEKTRSAFDTIRRVCGKEVSLAAGTVIKPENVKAAAEFGVGCVVSPNTDEEIIRLTKELGMLSVPGAFTPSEIVKAYNMGADLVKIFPILPDNIQYLKTVISPLSHIPFITTGGVNPDTASKLLEVGAAAVAAGASIITPKALEQNDYKAIQENAKAHIDAVRGD